MRKLATLIAAAALLVGFATAAQALCLPANGVTVLIIECVQNSDRFEVKAGSKTDNPNWGEDHKDLDCAKIHAGAFGKGY